MKSLHAGHSLAGRSKWLAAMAGRLLRRSAEYQAVLRRFGGKPGD